MKKLKHSGFNMYKHGKFHTVFQTSVEEEAVEKMKSYVKANQTLDVLHLGNDKEEYFTYCEFRKHSTEGFKTKQLKTGKEILVVDEDNPYKCAKCGSLNVQTKDWIEVNTGKPTYSFESDDLGDNWCPDCNEHCKIIDNV